MGKEANGPSRITLKRKGPKSFITNRNLQYEFSKNWTSSNFDSKWSIQEEIPINLTIMSNSATKIYKKYKSSKSNYNELIQSLKQDGLIARNKTNIRVYSIIGMLWNEEALTGNFHAGQHIILSLKVNKKRPIKKFK